MRKNTKIQGMYNKDVKAFNAGKTVNITNFIGNQMACALEIIEIKEKVKAGSIDTTKGLELAKALVPKYTMEVCLAAQRMVMTGRIA